MTVRKRYESDAPSSGTGATLFRTTSSISRSAMRHSKTRHLTSDCQSAGVIRECPSSVMTPLMHHPRSTDIKRKPSEIQGYMFDSKSSGLAMLTVLIRTENVGWIMPQTQTSALGRTRIVTGWSSIVSVLICREPPRSLAKRRSDCVHLVRRRPSWPE